MKDGITVIIPCYNVEKYLDSCVQSIINQTYKNLEIILVDDCSTDNTWKIIKQYEKKYDNIKALKNEKNSGAGYSRNRAVEIASNQYISFIDSDDYIELNFYETMLKQMKKEKADVVVCDIFVRYDNVEGTDTRSVACIKPTDKYSFINNGLAASPCNKIFNKDQLLKYKFLEGTMNEDIPTVLAILVTSSKIAYNTSTYYNYIQRKSSVQNATLSNKRFDIFKALDALEARIPRNQKNKKYWDAIIYNQIIMFLIYVIPKENDSKKRKQFLKRFNELSLKYEIRQNHLWWDFLAAQGKKHKVYYRTLLKLTCEKHYTLANLLISFYKWYSKNVNKSVIKENITIDDIVFMAKKQSEMEEGEFKLSVVVPNYNYEKFLYQRIYSILYQKEKISELIILDDCSKDNSRELIDEIVEKTKDYINIKKVYNETNSGTAFKQWEKGFKEATGDYVWIAEADDYCDNKFLKTVLKPIKNDNDIVISYCDTAFIDKMGNVILKSIKQEIDIMKTGHWDSDFVNEGSKEIKDYSFLNCTIANVSSVIFKNNNYSKYFKLAGKYRQCGDWLFYVKVMNDGKISYVDKTFNYYRVHGSNVTSLTKKQKHFDEIKLVHNEIDKMYKFDKKQKSEINKRYKFLRRVWSLDDEKDK